MAHIILTGATGTAGAAILAHALLSPSISRISILSRRPVALAENEPKARVYLHSDFTAYPPSTLAELQTATACIWAQGKSSRGMTETEYTTLTHDYPLAAAKAFATLPAEKFNFVYVSAHGARSDEGGMLFSRVKGKAENALLKLQEEKPTLKVYSVRPGGINQEGKYLAERTPTLFDKAHTVLGGYLSFWKSMVIKQDDLALVSVRLALGDGKPLKAEPGVEVGGRVIECFALTKLAEEFREAAK